MSEKMFENVELVIFNAAGQGEINFEALELTTNTEFSETVRSFINQGYVVSVFKDLEKGVLVILENYIGFYVKCLFIKEINLIDVNEFTSSDIDMILDVRLKRGQQYV